MPNTRRLASCAVLLAAAAVPAPATAQHVALEADRGCYAPNQAISLTGYGFTPEGDVALSADGEQLGIGTADYDGIFSAILRAPALPFAEIGLRLTATDQTYRLNRAHAYVRLTSVGVLIAPTGGDPARPRRIRARGFFDGRTLYAHVRRGERVRNVRIGRLRGACRRLSVTRRLFGPAVRPGSYKLHFDTSPRLVSSDTKRITYAVTIARRPAGATASTAAVTERWRLVSP